MPIYGYRCQSCDAEFEVVQRMSDPAVASCPTCEGAGTRLFYPAGIVFKGSGFYKTDSRSSSTASTSLDGSSSKPASTTSEPATTGTGSSPTPAAPAPTTPAPAPSPSKSSAASTD